MLKYPSVLILLLLVNWVTAQSSSKKALDHESLISWKTISSYSIASDGSAVLYQLNSREGDPSIHIYDTESKETTVFPRGKSASWSADGSMAAFLLSPSKDSLKAMRRRKIKKNDLPGDTLAIYSMDQSIVKIPDVKSFILPEKWSGWLVYHLEPAKKDSTNKDQKKENDENGSRLVIRNLISGVEDTLFYATQVVAAEEAPGFLATSTGDEEDLDAGVYYFDVQNGAFSGIFTEKGKYSQLTLDEQGEQAAFLADLDTTKAKIRNPELGYWKQGMPTADLITLQADDLLEDGLRIGPDTKPEFSANGERLYFGIGKEPILQDTGLLKEEIVNVEVWTWQDAQLYPQQEVRADDEEKRTYQTVWLVDQQRFISLGSESMPSVDLGNEGNADVALGTNDRPYLKSISWEGGPARSDIYLIDVNTGTTKQIGERVRAFPRLSPEARFVSWYLREDSSYNFYHVETGQTLRIPASEEMKWYDETNDRPMKAGSNGIAGWLEGDGHILVNDRYDIWKIDPTGNSDPIRLTRGRESETVYRYIRLDREQRFIPRDEKILLHIFDQKTKGSGYAWLEVETGEIEEITRSADHLYSQTVRKAKNAEKYVFTRQNTIDFPDLYLSDDLNSIQQISTANPQQQDYNWCTKELFEWTDPNGKVRQGLIIKPENFDPVKQYPAIVYFYERYAQQLNRHYVPAPSRSIINFTFYASRGYVIFIPDIWYQEGYPGKSAYDAVVSGTLALLKEGYVDRDRLGIQGHSWGGYQDAYIITQTDLFKCAESGAPVVNMTSAYGGIRWGTGLSRMFQYEHTQSRIGGSLWEYPMRYLENSPLFYLDKVNTPVLILHNDEDTAVPWYQGIEFFVALRRLGKPAWLLNYNGEPHGIRQLQNQKDFTRRMQQFFDHYLMDEPMPNWMKKGVPPLEKGIQQGFELSEE